MTRDVAKSFGDEPGTGKLYAVCAALAVIAHFLPWRLTSLGMFGEGTEMGFKIGALGVISGTALIAAVAGYANSLLAELTQAGKRNLALLLVALTAVAAVLQLVFFFQTGGTQKGLLRLAPQSAAWGFYIALLATLAAVVLGALRTKSLPSAAPEAPAPAPPSAPSGNPQ